MNTSSWIQTESFQNRGCSVLLIRPRAHIHLPAHVEELINRPFSSSSSGGIKEPNLPPWVTV